MIDYCYHIPQGLSFMCNAQLLDNLTEDEYDDLLLKDDAIFFGKLTIILRFYDGAEFRKLEKQCSAF